MCVETLQRVYVWARISSVTETGEIRGLVEQRPHADGRVWLRALEGWIAFMRLPPPAHGAGGKALIRGLRRCHPASRQPALAEYDVVRLLEMFGWVAVAPRRALPRHVAARAVATRADVALRGDPQGVGRGAAPLALSHGGAGRVECSGCGVCGSIYHQTRPGISSLPS